MDGRKDPIVSWNEENVGGRCGRGRESGGRGEKLENGGRRQEEGRRNGAREGKKHRLQRLFVHVSAPMGREPSLFHAFRYSYSLCCLL